jgi:hypothetical protein
VKQDTAEVFAPLRQEARATAAKVWELGFFKDLIANEANFAELQQKGYVRYEDMALEGHDGKRHEVEFVSNVYLVNQHKVIQCNIRDITERKRAEAELDRMRNLLAEGQRIAHLGSWEYWAETQETLWSEEQLRIYGLNPAGPSPDYQVMLRNHIHPEDAAQLGASSALRGVSICGTDPAQRRLGCDK